MISIFDEHGGRTVIADTQRKYDITPAYERARRASEAVIAQEGCLDSRLHPRTESTASPVQIVNRIDLIE